MSAWLCTDKHFMFLAQACKVHRLVDDADYFARMLKLENLRSLEARYRKECPESIDGVTLDPATDISDIASFIEDPQYVHRQAACLDYQSCEHVGWEESAAFKTLAELFERLGGRGEEQFPERRDDIPWGIR